MKKTAIWLVVYAMVLLWSLYQPHDMFTWWLEALPGLIALPLLGYFYYKHRPTALISTLILLHCCILFVGAKYTYAEVPLFDWISSLFDWQRNNYDKLGHFAQGFIPAMICREVLLRNKVLVPSGWCGFLCTCFALALSAFYELVEWWVAVATGDGADSFLGTQGYVWDTQSDMLMALIGAICAMVFLSSVHNKQLVALNKI